MGIDDCREKLVHIMAGVSHRDRRSLATAEDDIVTAMNRIVVLCDRVAEGEVDWARGCDCGHCLRRRWDWCTRHLYPVGMHDIDDFGFVGDSVGAQVDDRDAAGDGVQVVGPDATRIPPFVNTVV